MGYQLTHAETRVPAPDIDNGMPSPSRPHYPTTPLSVTMPHASHRTVTPPLPRHTTLRTRAIMVLRCACAGALTARWWHQAVRTTWWRCTALWSGRCADVQAGPCAMQSSVQPASWLVWRLMQSCARRAAVAVAASAAVALPASKAARVALAIAACDCCLRALLPGGCVWRGPLQLGVPRCIRPLGVRRDQEQRGAR